MNDITAQSVSGVLEFAFIPPYPLPPLPAVHPALLYPLPSPLSITLTYCFSPCQLHPFIHPSIHFTSFDLFYSFISFVSFKHYLSVYLLLSLPTLHYISSVIYLSFSTSTVHFPHSLSFIHSIHPSCLSGIKWLTGKKTDRATDIWIDVIFLWYYFIHSFPLFHSSIIYQFIYCFHYLHYIIFLPLFTYPFLHLLFIFLIHCPSSIPFIHLASLA